jgi:hypothetical protein
MKMRAYNLILRECIRSLRLGIGQLPAGVLVEFVEKDLLMTKVLGLY